jgi:hypothetical protein
VAMRGRAMRWRCAGGRCAGGRAAAGPIDRHRYPGILLFY